MPDKIVRLKTNIANQSTVHRVYSNTTSPPLQWWKQTRVSCITHRQKTAKITGIHNGATMLQANCGRKQSEVKHSQEQDPFETRQWESWIKNRIETENLSLWSETNGGDYRASLRLLETNEWWDMKRNLLRMWNIIANDFLHVPTEYEHWKLLANFVLLGLPRFHCKSFHK